MYNVQKIYYVISAAKQTHSAAGSQFKPTKVEFVRGETTCHSIKFFIKPIFHFFLHTQTPNLPSSHAAGWLPEGALGNRQRWWNSALVSSFLYATHRERVLHNPKIPSDVSDQPNVVVSHEQILPPSSSVVCFEHFGFFFFFLLRNTMPKPSELHCASITALQLCGMQGFKSHMLCWIDWTNVFYLSIIKCQ